MREETSRDSGSVLEARWHNRDEDDNRLEPILEIGGRYDGGDAETGFGIDVGTGLSWTNRDLGLEAELRARGLLSLDDKRFVERGFAGSLSWISDPLSNLGPSLSLSQTVGASATGGAEALLARDTMAGLADDNGDSLGSPVRGKARLRAPPAKQSFHRNGGARSSTLRYEPGVRPRLASAAGAPRTGRS